MERLASVKTWDEYINVCQIGNRASFALKPDETINKFFPESHLKAQYREAQLSTWLAWAAFDTGATWRRATKPRVINPKSGMSPKTTAIRRRVLDTRRMEDRQTGTLEYFVGSSN